MSDDRQDRQRGSGERHRVNSLAKQPFLDQPSLLLARRSIPARSLSHPAILARWTPLAIRTGLIKATSSLPAPAPVPAPFVIAPADTCGRERLWLRHHMLREYDNTYRFSRVRAV